MPTVTTQTVTATTADACDCCGETVPVACCPDVEVPATLYLTITLCGVTSNVTLTYNAGLGRWQGGWSQNGGTYLFITGCSGVNWFWRIEYCGANSAPGDYNGGLTCDPFSASASGNVNFLAPPFGPDCGTCVGTRFVTVTVTE